MAKQTKIRTAEELALEQRAISVAEFFEKNRHLLGFDNPAKALLTVVREAVDNSLDACEDARILPEIKITVREPREIYSVMDDEGDIIGEFIVEGKKVRFFSEGSTLPAHCHQKRQGLFSGRR